MQAFPHSIRSSDSFHTFLRRLFAWMALFVISFARGGPPWPEFDSVVGPNVDLNYFQVTFLINLQYSTFVLPWWWFVPNSKWMKWILSCFLWFEGALVESELFLPFSSRPLHFTWPTISAWPQRDDWRRGARHRLFRPPVIPVVYCMGLRLAEKPSRLINHCTQ